MVSEIQLFKLYVVADPQEPLAQI